MLGGIRTELVTLPVEAGDRIIPRLRESGIAVEPSTRRKPKRLTGAGEILTCTQDGGTAEILIVCEDFPPELQHMTAVLVFPSVGFLTELKHRVENARLRETIHSILYELKEAASSE